MGEDNSYTIRQMTTTDIEQVLTVEESTFNAPWKSSVFCQELKENKFAHYFVYEYKGTVIGYCGLWVIVDQAQITNIAILAEHRGKKLGEKLLTYVIAYARLLGAKRLSLEVRVSNNIAQSLYRKLGFQAGGIRKKITIQTMQRMH